jgi:bifunctional aspartokinase / homoserine dehydrogenase 1
MGVTVMKFGGSSLRDAKSLMEIADIIRKNSFSWRVVVLSAVSGVTNQLISATDRALESEGLIADSVAAIRKVHDPLIAAAVTDHSVRDETVQHFEELYGRLKKLLKGVAYTGEATQRTRDHILSLGERMAVHLMSGCLSCIGVRTSPVESDSIGMIAHGPFGQGTVDLVRTRKSIGKRFHEMFHDGILPCVTGFFGETEDGQPITFGRGGTDYSAAVIAGALDAERLEVWKDVDGFLTGSPEFVRNPQFLSSLSYDEAAELSYFGAKILHPRTVEPLFERKIPIVIRNTFKPDGVGTWIGPERHVREGIVKSVTYSRNAGMLRLHGPDIGYAVGLLARLVSQLSGLDINIRSVMTSQTCINILLDRSDLQKAYNHLKSMKVGSIDALEAEEKISLVAVVGEGLDRAEGLVSRVIQSLSQVNIHTEMIIAGASRVAAYFIVDEDKLKRAVTAVHDGFFGAENEAGKDLEHGSNGPAADKNG